jgi:hypothetical protein
MKGKDMQYTHMTLKSRNAKTGPIPVSTTGAESCPTSCPFNNNNAGGCYAAGGPLAIHWRKVSEKRAGESFNRFLEKVAALPQGQLWRHNQAGDLQGKGNRINAASLRDLVKANRGKRGFTYTHKPMTRANAALVKEANENGFTINLSANNLRDADRLAALDAGPVVVVLPSNATENTTTPAGRKVVVCPATQRDDVSCATCGLCARLRDSIVGFPAHGAAKRKADSVAVA